MFNMRMGIPEIKNFWAALETKIKDHTAKKNEIALFKKLVSCFKKLSSDPKYPGLCTHDIEALTKRYGKKVWESYLENNKPAAGRIFWVYGPNKSDITIIGLEPHPNDKKDAYRKITLSATDKSNVNNEYHKFKADARSSRTPFNELLDGHADGMLIVIQYNFNLYHYEVY